MFFEEVAQFIQGGVSKDPVGLADHQAVKGGLARREQQIAHAQHALQVALSVGYVQVLHIVAGILVPVGLKIIEHVLNGLTAAKIEKLRDHQTTGSIFLELKEVASLFRLLRLHLFDNGVGVVFVQFTEQVCDMIAVEFREDRRRLLWMKFFDDLRCLGIGNVLDHLCGIFRTEQGHQAILFGGGQTGDDPGCISGIEGF